jgi:hypothetical protein
VWAGAFVLPVADPIHARMLAYEHLQAGWAFGLAAATAATALLLTRGVIRPTVALALLIVIQFGDVLQFGYDQNNGPLDIEQYYSRGRERLGPLLAGNGGEFFRVVTRSGRWVMLDRNQGMVDHVFQLEGYTPLALQRRVPPAPTLSRSYDLLNAKYRVVVDSQAGRMAFALFPSYLPRAYLVHDARVMDSSAVDAFMRSDAFDPRRLVVLDGVECAVPSAQCALPRDPYAKTTDSAMISQYRLNAIDLKVTTSEPAMLVLSEIFYPGWHAYVDGAATKVLRADWNLRAIPVPAGPHRVEMRFEPAPLRQGAMVTAITLLVAFGMLIWPLARSRTALRLQPRP